MHVLGLCGSLRRNSYNRRLLAAAAKELPDTATFQSFDHLAAIPAYNEDLEVRDMPAAVGALRRAIATASGVVIATPEYNASVPGLLKNAIDWASRPYPNHALRGKPVIVIGTSTSDFGAVVAQAELRRVLSAMGAAVLQAELPVSKAKEAFTRDGRLANPLLREQLANMVLHLVNVAAVDGAHTCA